MASLSLTHCLNKNPGMDNNDCWQNARQTNENCYKNVQASHRRDIHREKAIEKARKDKENELQKRSTQIIVQ